MVQKQYSDEFEEQVIKECGRGFAMDNRVVQVLWIARYDYQPGWKLKEHEHEYFQMIYILDGNGRLLIDRLEYEASKDMLFFIRPKMCHGLNTNSNSTLKTLDIKFVINDLGLDNIVQNVIKVLYMDNQEIKVLLERIRNEGIKHRPFYMDFGCIYLIQILFILLRRQVENSVWESNGKANRTVSRDSNTFNYKIEAFIEHHYCEELTLKDIAQAVGYNPSYICQYFKKAFGNTLMRYLYGYRIEKAKELMIRSDYSLEQIAAMVGFKSIHHFTRVFHEHEGTPPAQWRKKEKDGIWKDVYLSEGFQNHDITEKT